MNYVLSKPKAACVDRFDTQVVPFTSNSATSCCCGGMMFTLRTLLGVFLPVDSSSSMRHRVVNHVYNLT